MHILRIFLVLVVLTMMGVSSAAAAEGLQGDAGIDDEISEGIALRRAGNDEGALAIFLDLEKRAPDSVRVLLHVSTAALASGKYLMAYDYLQKASAHKDDPYYQRHKAAIENVGRAILSRVGQFRAHGSPAGAEVRLNGEAVGTLPMSSVKTIEVGSYTLEVSKPGYFPLRRMITVVGDGNLTQESVDLHEQKPLTSAAGTGQTALQGGPLAPDTGPQPPWIRARWVTWTLAGVAVVAGATSGVAFAIREEKAVQWNNDTVCQNGSLTRDSLCGPTRHDINVAQGVGIGAGIAAVAFGGAAIVHWLSTATHGEHPEGTSARPQGKAWCNPGLGSIVCSGSF